MGVSYQDTGSPLVTASQHGIWKAGYRCPDMVLQSHGSSGGEGKRLYSQVSYGKYVILAVGNHAQDDGAPLGHGDVAVRYDVVAATTSSSTGADSGTEINGQAAAEANLVSTTSFTADWVLPEEEPFTVVIRPDMYIGYVGKDVASCRQYLDELFTSS